MSNLFHTGHQCAACMPSRDFAQPQILLHSRASRQSTCCNMLENNLRRSITLKCFLNRFNAVFFFLPVFECISLPPVEINIFLPQKSEEMKKKGNEHFEKQQYEEAVKYYSKAIEY